MNTPLKKRRDLHLGRTLITGILAALPLLATLWLLSFLLGFVFRWLGPDSIVGQVLGALGVGVSGHGWTGYLMGLLLVILALFVLGLLVERGLAAWMGMLVDRIVGRIPVVRTIYETLEKFVSIFSQRGDSQFASMRPVWCRFGESGQVAALALLSSPEPILVGGRACYALIIPTSPVPIGGGLLFVPVEWVEPANVGIEAVTSIYVSMGVTAPQFLPKAESNAS